MKTLTYPQPPAWSWPTTNSSFTDPNPWQPRKWVEQITRQLRAADLPTVAHRLFGGQAATPPEGTSGSLTTFGKNREQIGAVRECVLIRQRGRQVLTALRSADNHLQLVSWRVNANGSVVRTGESGVQPETITQLDIAHASKFVIACRTASRHLKLISWDVGNTGAIYRAGESKEQPTPISKVKLVALTSALLLTATITTAGQLQLTSWQLDATADLAPLYQLSRDEALRELTLVHLPGPENSQRVMTVARTRRGELRLQVWQVSPSGEITLLGQSTATEEGGTQIQAVVNEQGVVITSLRTPSGHLRLNTWHISTDGSQIEQFVATEDRGERIRHQALMYLPGGVITAVTLPHGQLQLTAWEVSAEGHITRSRNGDKTATSGHNLALCPALLDGNAPILTSMRTAQGGLELTTWQG